MEVNMNNYFKVLFFLSLVSGLSATKDNDLEKLSAAFKSKATIVDSSSEGYNSEDLPGASDEDESSSCPIFFEVETQTEPEEEAVVYISNKKTQTKAPLVYCNLITRTPQYKISDKFKDLLSNSTNIKACFYTFTLFDVAQIMADKFKANANYGTLIVNHAYREYLCQAIKHIVQAGMPCYTRAPQPTNGIYAEMHEKFCVMEFEDGNKIAWHGSWNCTGQADENNDESVIITNSPSTISSLKKRFEKFLAENQNTKKIKEADCTSTKPGSYTGRSLNRIPRNLW